MVAVFPWQGFGGFEDLVRTRIVCSRVNRDAEVWLAGSGRSLCKKIPIVEKASASTLEFPVLAGLNRG